MASTQSDDASIKNQENAAARGSSSRIHKQPVRHRASVACASCRDRRIRCVVPKGESTCTQCRRAGAACIITHDDERRRPISKAYMASLSERIRLLERMLSERGVALPPAVHLPRTRHRAEPMSPPVPAQPHAALSTDGSPSRDDATPPASAHCMMHDDDTFIIPSLEDVITMNVIEPATPASVHSSDQTTKNLGVLAQSLHSYQETSALHCLSPKEDTIYAETADTREPERILWSLTDATHDYLLDCFWQCYNDMIYVLDRAAFEAGRATQNPKFYTTFLHIAVLAMGYRFADRRRADMRPLRLGSRESTLQRAAKGMLDTELERRGGLPSVQALLLLGDLECGVGRDNTGWMYAGMANRLALAMGLHRDGRSTDTNAADVHLRHMVMRATLVMDRHWALFRGRPTTIRSQDVGMDVLTKRPSTVASVPDAARAKMSNEAIYEYLFALVALAGKIVDRPGSKSDNQSSKNQNDSAADSAASEENAYLNVVSVDSQLQNWYRRLPDHLAWTPANIKTAPMSFFLLHQQYHASMILLHRPWAQYGAIVASDSEASASTGTRPLPAGSTMHGPPSPDDRRTALSRSICTQHAVHVARIVAQHRQRFDGRCVGAAGSQHAGTAAMALMAALAHRPSSAADRRSCVDCLELLSCALADMGHTYQPAARMDALLRAVLEQLRSDVDGPAWLGGAGMDAYSVLPVRCESPDSAGVQTCRTRRPTTARAPECRRAPSPFFASNGRSAAAASSSATGCHLLSAGHDAFDLDVLNGSAMGDWIMSESATVQASVEHKTEGRHHNVVHGGDSRAGGAAVEDEALKQELNFFRI